MIPPQPDLGPTLLFGGAGMLFLAWVAAAFLPDPIGKRLAVVFMGAGFVFLLKPLIQ